MDLASIDHVLTTTRSVRKRLDLTRPVEAEIIQECLEIAIQAPTGGNIPRYHFVVVTDPEKRDALAAIYKRSYWEVYSSERQEEIRKTDPRLIDSATYLAEHMHEVPVLIIPCVEAAVVQTTGPGAYASILPAAWSLMLALRARGIGAAWTTLHLRYEKEAAAVLGIPDGIAQAALFPVAYYTGDDFKPARRIPARERTYWNGWGQRRYAALSPSPEAPVESGTWPAPHPGPAASLAGRSAPP